MNTNLEQIDELRKRAHVSYETAKEALEKCNGDMVEALIYLEKQNKVKTSTTSTFFGKLQDIINKGNRTSLVIKKNEKTILSIPVTAAVLITVFAFHIVIIVLVIALLTGHRISFEGSECNLDKVNDTLNKVSDKVDELKN
jgi:Domain of unknown function (DUF4342)